jgi:hypothetical protein
MNTRSELMMSIFAILILTVFVSAQSRLLTDPLSLSQFPTVEQVRAATKGTDEVDSHARFMAALFRINSIIIDDLVTARNGGRYDIPAAADRVHSRYSNAITRFSIDQIPPAGRDPRYLKLRDKYEQDPGFLDVLLVKFFTPEFRSDYYAWVRKPIPQSSTPLAAGSGKRAISAPQSSTHATAGAGKGAITPPATMVQCPKVKLSSPSEVDADMPITFTVSLTGGDPNTTPTFNWTVSDGTIQAGQGTSMITVDTTGVVGQSLNATVGIGGYDPVCETGGSITTGIKPKPQPARRFDEYGAIRLNDRNAHLDNFAIELQNDPTATGYVIAYAGRKSLRGAATSLVNTVKNYLVNTRGIAAFRIVTVDGGYREDPTTVLWIVPQGGTPPQPTPTVDPSQIKTPIKKKPVPKGPKKPTQR